MPALRGGLVALMAIHLLTTTLAALVASLIGLTAACGAAPAARPAAPPSSTLVPVNNSPVEPRSGGKVTVYSALSDTTNRAMVAAFAKAQPVISVEVLSLAAAGELQAHIQAERRSPRADIFLGGSSEYHEPLGREGLLEPYHSPGATSVDSAFRDPEGHWTGWYIGVLGTLVNTTRWNSDEIAASLPSSWDDLLAPKLAGKIALPDPHRTGAGYIFLANQLFRFDRDESKASEYFRRLRRNLGELTETSPEAIKRVAAGDYPIGVNWSHDILAATAGGSPVALAVPEGTAFEIGAVSIVKGGPNPTGARAFVDWILSRESAQTVVQTSNRLSVLKRIEPAPGSPTLDSVKLVNYDRAWAADNRDRLLQIWQNTAN